MQVMITMKSLATKKIGVNMTIVRKKLATGKFTIDLTGPQGNAFVLMGYAKTFSKQLNLDYEKITEEMRSGDYDNLINVFDNYFGDYVILEKG
jgi:hypothetical protein